jgi:uncharacterized membrane protein
MGAGLILLGVFAVIAVIVLLEVKDIRNKFLMFGLFGLIAFFAGTFIYVAYAGGSSLTTFDGFIESGRLYTAWLTGFFDNLGDITAYTVKQSWGVGAVNATG